MHSQRDFFYAVLSGLGRPCIAWKVPGKAYFEHETFDTIEGMCEYASRIDYTLSDYYFCISTLERASVDVAGKRRVRIKPNCIRTRVFILDVDIRPEKEGHYATIDDGIAGIHQVKEQLNLPEPIIVNSGYGLHAYWTLAEGIDSEEWAKLAAKFKKAIELIAPECVADGSRVSDQAGVLRIPDSYNLKNGKQVPVKIVHWGNDAVDIQQIRSLLERIIPDKNVKPKGIGLELVREELPPAEFANVVKNCNWMGEYMKARATASEPEWYAALGVTNFTVHTGTDSIKTGHDLSHYISRAYSGYNEAETDRKIAQVVAHQTGPTTCEKLESINASRCEGCPFRGAIKSPCQVSRLSKPAAEPKEVETTVITESGDHVRQTITIPNPPKPYFRGEDGGVFVRAKDEDGNDIIERVYDYDLYPVKRYRTESIEAELIEVHVWLPHDGLRIFKMPTGLLADTRKLSGFLAEKGVIPEAGIAKSNRLARYMIDYMRHLQNTGAAEVEFSRFGWRDIGSASPKFIVSDGVITKEDGIQQASYAAHLRDASEAVETTGEMSEWKKGFMVYKDIPNSEPFILAALLGFAAPLMAMTEYSGVLYNMVGASAGGKSTALKVMSSVFGKPKSSHLLIGDTIISTFNHIGYLGSMPVAFDELTNMEADKLSQFALNFTSGRGKMRAGRNGENQANHVVWDTIVCASSNSSLYDKLAQHRRGYTAEAMRIFETVIGSSEVQYKNKVDTSMALLKNNYGMAGREYIAHIIKNVPNVRKAVNDAIDSIASKGGLKTEERFWAALFACVAVGGTIAKNMKLHSYDVNALLAWALNRTTSETGARQTIRTSVSDPISILSDFFNTNLDSILKFKDGNIDLSGDASKVRSIKSRIEYSGAVPCVAYISAAAMKDYCLYKKVDLSWFKKELQDMGIITKDNQAVRLASGTSLTNLPTKCWKVDMTHKMLTEVFADE